MEERKIKSERYTYYVKIDVSMFRGVWADLEHRFHYVRANNGKHVEIR